VQASRAMMRAANSQRLCADAPAALCSLTRLKRWGFAQGVCVYVICVCGGVGGWVGEWVCVCVCVCVRVCCMQAPLQVSAF